MPIYIVGDIEVEAEDAKQLVDRMAETSRSPSETAATWMEDAAARYRMISNADIRTDTADHFVEDLMNLKIITLQEELSDAELGDADKTK